MNKTLSEIQAELKVWTIYNFGKQKSIIPIMGMIEELGELTHAHLKELQGIRKSDYLADKKDAIGDFTIYLLNWFNCINKDISIINLTTISKNVTIGIIENKVSAEDAIIDLNILIGHTRDNSNQFKALGEDIISAICYYCNLYNINFNDTINEVWEQVKLRDWKLYPLNGKTE